MARRRNFRTRRSDREESPHPVVEVLAQTQPSPADVPEEPAGGLPWETVRPDKVAKAKQLVQDENYPSKEVLEKVADLLAGHLRGGEQGNHRESSI